MTRRVMRTASVRRDLRRRLALVRREALVEGLAVLGHVEQQLGRLEALAELLLEALAQLDELLSAHHVDIGERAARERREAEAEDRADVGLAHVRDDAILHGACGFHR